MAVMIDWNFMTVVIVIALFLLWKLELVATLLNLKAFPTRVPPELDGLMDEEKLDRAREYIVANARSRIVQDTVSLVALLVFWFLGGFEWLDGFARSLAISETWAGLVFLSAIFLAKFLLGLPFEIHHTFGTEKRFGFNRTTPGTYVADQVKSLLLMALLGLPLAAAVLWIFRNVPNAWLWAWLLFTAVQLLLTYLAPSLILPLFNKFTPMEDGDLKRDIEKLGERCGFPLDEVFVMDGSKRSSKANAFFTGLGKRKKIALYDTLVEKCSTPELLGVLAHEIGHFRRGHIKQRLAAGVIQTGVMFYLLGLAVSPDGVFARTLFDAFGVKDVSPHVGLVLFAILMEPVGTILGVILNAWSRKHEFEADAYAREATGEAKPLADALRNMTVDHLSHPAPGKLRVWLDYSHPPLIERLRALRG